LPEVQESAPEISDKSGAPEVDTYAAADEVAQVSDQASNETAGDSSADDEESIDKLEDGEETISEEPNPQELDEPV